MDISRPDLKQRKRRRTILTFVVVLLLACAAALALHRLKPALPTVDAAVYTDTVKRGPLLRQVRGPGTLVPREDKIRLIPAETEATVVRIRVLPGAHVEPDTILMDLVDPAVQQQMLDAQLQLKSAQADYQNTRAKLQSDMMTEPPPSAPISTRRSCRRRPTKACTTSASSAASPTRRQRARPTSSPSAMTLNASASTSTARPSPRSSPCSRRRWSRRRRCWPSKRSSSPR